MSRLTHTLHFAAAHTVASALTLAIFMVPLLLPYTPYAAYMDWHSIFPYLKPYAIGLGVSIWLITLAPALIVHKIIRMAGLYNRQDYLLIGAATGLAISLPVLKIMGANVVNTDITPLATHGWVVANQLVYAAAWGLSGAAFGLCYYYMHREPYSPH